MNQYPFKISRILICLTLFFQHQVAESFEQATTKQDSVNRSNKASQETIDRLSQEANDLYTEYKVVREETKNLAIYNNQLEKVIQSQLTEMESLKNQIAGIERTNQSLVPLMLQMLDTLDKFIQLDTPFLENERKNRISSLKDMMNRADVSASEKYRRILEAYQIESEYGRTIEAYREDEKPGPNQKTLEYLRIGRIGFFSMTLDGGSGSFWDNESKSWKELDGRYLKSVKNGIKMAKKQSAPDLLTIPVYTKGAN